MSSLEKVLNSETPLEEIKTFKTILIQVLNIQIDQSELDFQNNRYKNSAELLA